MKYLPLALICSLLCGFIPYGSFASAETPETLLHENKYYTIRYPFGWSKVSDQNAFGTLWLVPKRDDPTVKDLRVKISVLNFPHTGKDYFMAVSSQLQQEKLNAITEYVTMGKEAANRIVCQETQGEAEFQRIRYITVKDAIAFDIEFRFPQERQADLQPTIDQMIRSFRFAKR